MTISQVQLSNTFNEFRQSFNTAANTINDLESRVITGSGTILSDEITANTLFGENLTNGRVLIGGSAGLITDDDGLTYNSSTNTLSTGALVLTTSANVGSSLVVGTSASVGTTLAVTGATTLSNTLSVTGTSTLTGKTTFGSGANNAVYHTSNGSLILTSSGDAQGTGRLEANHVHATWHVGSGGNLETWATSKGDNADTHKVFAVANTNAAVDMMIVNQNEGANAYAEFIAIHATGNTADGWVSMGVNSTNYAEGAYGVTKADDAYLLYSAPVGTTESGDLVIGTSGNGTGNRIIFSADGFDDPANNTQMTITPGQNVYININTQSSNTTTGALVVNGGIGLQGNLNIGGNVAITGTITLGGGGNTVSTSSLAVDNPIIFLGSNNAADTFDLGFNGEYTSSGTKYTGFVRDASDSGKWKLYSGISNKPANTVNFTGATYDTLYLGGIESVSTTASSSTTTGAIKTSGGLGVAGAAYVGGVLRNTDSTASSSSSTGATVVTGGLGVGGAINSGSSISDSKGNLRSVPQNSQSTSYVLVAADAGKHISTTAAVTVNTGIFSVGDVISIYNNSGSSISITQGASVTLRLAGTATTGTRTLAQRGLVNLLCVASNEFVCSGSGVS